MFQVLNMIFCNKYYEKIKIFLELKKYFYYYIVCSKIYKTILKLIINN